MGQKPVRPEELRGLHSGNIIIVEDDESDPPEEAWQPISRGELRQLARARAAARRTGREQYLDD